MAKKPQPQSSSSDRHGRFSDRNLIAMFTLLTHTLENICGRDTLAEHLAGLRRAKTGSEAEPPHDPALERVFRRLGGNRIDSNADSSVLRLAEDMGEAVTRPTDHILAMFRLFSHGDEKLGVKAVCGITPQCRACLLTRHCEYFNNPRKPEIALLTPAARLMAAEDMALSDAELLGVALYGEKATGREEVVETLLTRYGRLRAIFRAGAHEYAAIRGMGRPEALRLAAMGALHRRLMVEKRGDLLRISSARDIYDRYAAELRDYETEAVILLLLDRQNQVIRSSWLCDDAPNLTNLGVRDLLRPALREAAPRMALVHNHPSNNPSPSNADLDFTRRLQAASDIVGIELVDHVIVTEDGYFSFAEEGMLGR